MHQILLAESPCCVGSLTLDQNLKVLRVGRTALQLPLLELNSKLISHTGRSGVDWGVKSTQKKASPEFALLPKASCLRAFPSRSHAKDLPDEASLHARYKHAYMADRAANAVSSSCIRYACIAAKG